MFSNCIQIERSLKAKSKIVSKRNNHRIRCFDGGRFILDPSFLHAKENSSGFESEEDIDRGLGHVRPEFSRCFTCELGSTLVY